MILSHVPAANEPITLDNCAREPIHIPNLIQPHGAMLVFEPDGACCGWSANLPALLGLEPQLGQPFDQMGLDEAVREQLLEIFADPDCGEMPPVALETFVGQEGFDFVVHGHDGRVIAEFEHRQRASDEVAAFALKAHAAIDRLKRLKTVPALLQSAVEQIRAITGFDRVMAYRFRHDDSGDVVAEACRDDLDPYLGRRYPASDIPAQARRLYTINTLRLIADSAYQPVAVLGRPDDGPLDMSHSILRSVSPIHLEYLHNMGVAASMSVSIVINGKLWGLLACHHMTPRQVPYSIRMACDVLAQVLASTVQSLEARERTEINERAAVVRTSLIETLLHEEDVLRALERHAQDLRASLDAEALVIAQQNKLLTFGDISQEQAAAMLRSLPRASHEMLQRTALADWPQDLQPVVGKWVGMMALSFDPATDGWLLALRPEQIETVRWGGRPEKEVKTGPLGPRLTPRGSFDEWRETVRGKAEPWDETFLVIARRLLAEMHRASNARHVEMDRARTQLLAMLGHDLRDPLQSINMAASGLQYGMPQDAIGQRIQASSTRMQRLISQVLDLSRIKGGIGLGLQTDAVDLAAVINDLVDELRTAYPGATYETDLPEKLLVPGDADRLAQVISNLLSNARHHGAPGQPISVLLQTADARAILEVRNAGAAIDDATVANLFNPFKRLAAQSTRNRTGMGLGLYIAHEIVAAHGGTLCYSHASGQVAFTVELPLLGKSLP